MKRITKRQE